MLKLALALILAMSCLVHISAFTCPVSLKYNSKQISQKVTGPLLMAAGDEREKPKVTFGSKVLSEEEERRQAKARLEKMRKEDLGVYQKSDKNYSPSDFSSYKSKAGDVEFDGGDGQVGCVGDGKTNMEEFDDRAVIKGSSMVQESKQRQRNAWGSSANAGYAEKLKEQGMVDYNLRGDDMLKVRRQQLENYSNQMSLKRAQDAAIDQLEAAEGKKQVRTARDYNNALQANAWEQEDKWNVYKPEKVSAADIDFGPVTPGKTPRAEYEIHSGPGKAGDVRIEQRNIVMTYQPFRAAFPEGTSASWVVRPSSGELEKRGGAPTPLTVTYKPEVAGSSETVYLVVDTEEFKHTYKITGYSG